MQEFPTPPFTPPRRTSQYVHRDTPYPSPKLIARRRNSFLEAAAARIPLTKTNKAETENGNDSADKTDTDSKTSISGWAFLFFVALYLLGLVTGLWYNEASGRVPKDSPLYDEDDGHRMLFRSFMSLLKWVWGLIGGGRE
ncbi:hypothetical protein EDC01DRAFT_781418 [Geopyxis carbonaria]|nr:hypothetical protein EDC01DRAFT_781418 [Geopyxis carbonaria]